MLYFSNGKSLFSVRWIHCCQLSIFYISQCCPIGLVFMNQDRSSSWIMIMDYHYHESLSSWIIIIMDYHHHHRSSSLWIMIMIMDHHHYQPSLIMIIITLFHFFPCTVIVLSDMNPLLSSSMESPRDNVFSGPFVHSM